MKKIISCDDRFNIKKAEGPYGSTGVSLTKYEWVFWFLEKACFEMIIKSIMIIKKRVMNNTNKSRNNSYSNNDSNSNDNSNDISDNNNNNKQRQ